MKCLLKNEVCSVHNKKCKVCKLTDCSNTIQAIEEADKMYFKTKEEKFYKKLSKKYPRVCKL